MSMTLSPSSPARRAALRRQGVLMLFGQLLRDARERDGLSLEEAAGRAGIPIERWEGIEAGRLEAIKEEIWAMADALTLGRDGMFLFVFLCGEVWRHGAEYL